MNLGYIILSKLKEIAKNKKMAVIIVICLVLGYAFILIFSSKIFEINRRMEFAKIKNTENAYILSDSRLTDVQDDPDFENGIEHRSDYGSASVYVAFKNDTFMVYGTEIDEELPYFYTFDNFSYDLFDENNPEKQVMVSKYLANKYNMKVNDEIIVNGSVWNICSVYENEYLNKSIVFPINSNALENNDMHSRSSIIQFNENYLKSDPQILKGEGVTPLQRRQETNLKSLNMYKIFIVAFAVIFIVISILNCYLVFFSNINYKRKMYGIKKTYGASSSLCFIDVFLENCIFSLLALHISCLLVHVFRYNIPVFFYTEVNLAVYFSAMIVVLIVTVIYSLIIFKKINSISTIKLLKE